MIRAVLLLCVCVGVLALADLGLVRSASRERGTQRHAGALFAPDEAARLRRQPMVTLRSGGQTHRYGRIEGQWRCLTAFGAPADQRALGALLDGLSGAEGFVVARDASSAPRYGINTPTTITVRIEGPRALQDPGGDVQAEFDLGSGLAERNVCFLRPRGKPEVWQVSTNLRALVEGRTSPALPPLVAPGAIPAAWLEEAQGLARVECWPGDARSFALVRKDVPFDPTRPPPGKFPWAWDLEHGDETMACNPERAESYVRLIDSLPYVEILDPARREDLGSAAPRRRVTLQGRRGARLELALLAPLADGRVPLAIGPDGALFALEAEVAERLVPDPETLAMADGSPSLMQTPTSTPNPAPEQDSDMPLESPR